MMTMDEDEGDEEFAEPRWPTARRASERDERQDRSERPRATASAGPRPRARAAATPSRAAQQRCARDDDEPDARERAETHPASTSLPPAIGRDEPDAAEDEAEPRRRAAAPARPRPAEGDDEVAPAA